MVSFPQVLCLVGVLWITWRFIRRTLFPTVLENIPGPAGESWMSGSLNQMVNPIAWDWNKDISETYGPVIRTKGAFGSDSLYIFDPKAMHHILVKDELIYEETDRFVEYAHTVLSNVPRPKLTGCTGGGKLMFGNGILSALGDAHRRHRKMLNPVFSISHLREMAPVSHQIVNKVKRAIAAKVKKGPQEIDIADWTNRTALELIGQVGLGYSFDDLFEDGIQHPYGIASKQLFPLQGQNEFVGTIVVPKLTQIGTPAFRKFVVDLLPFKEVKQLRRIIDVLYGTAMEIFNDKKKAIEAGEEVGGAHSTKKGTDIISILMKANMVASESDKLSDDEVIAQINTMVFGATDTTSTAISRSLHQLALNKDVQEKLREEIRNARQDNGGQDPNYDDLSVLPYLDAVCKETLRLYPPAPWVFRITRQDSIIPLSKSIRGINGEQIHEIPVPKGTFITLGVTSSNTNRDLWGADANEWRPERWLSPLPADLVTAHIPGIYSHTMTFLGGPRSCIGIKFAELEIKVVLWQLVEELEFSIGSKEIIWQMTRIATPHLSRDSTDPTMPLLVVSRG